MQAADVRHLLSFDVEEYFHAEAAQRCGVRREDWLQMPRRLEPALDRILQLLSEYRVSATFFILGWVPEHQSHLVKKIASEGHEIASHGMSHQMLHRLSPEAFEEELHRSRALLEDITGTRVSGFRAPTFSITRPTSWALDCLCRCGYAYDSSVFPVRHDRYGVPEAPIAAHLARGPAGGRILEIPPLTRRMLGSNLPVGGGGYLRLFPVGWIASALRRMAKRGRPGTLYLHPWELDPDHPVLPMKRFQKWRHRVNLHKTAAKLTWLLERFAFRPIGALVDEIDQSGLETYDYSPSAHEGESELRSR
jgi:polysaccharide deacetylase family protein (PEP-CTERM system associated)